MVLERNPYYWKVDPEGRQLPYLDQIRYKLVNDANTMVLMALNGDIDMQDRTIGTPDNKPVFAANREKGDFGFFTVKTSDMNTAAISFNLTHKDPAKREVFASKDFRIGLSHAIDRPEIIKVLFKRQGKPWQLAPRPESKFFHRRLAEQYTAHDRALANEHLDRAGLTDRDAEGFRLGPDGKRVAFQLTFPTSFKIYFSGVAELLTKQWEAVGVQARPQALERSLFSTRKSANDFDVTIWAGELGGDLIELWPMWYIVGGLDSHGPLWSRWYDSDGKEGEEPPESIQRAMSLYAKLQATPDDDAQVAYMGQILDINADLFLAMGVSLPAADYGIVKNNFHNVPASMISDAPLHNPGPSNPQQYFIE